MQYNFKIIKIIDVSSFYTLKTKNKIKNIFSS
nr:MAG TPA: hypothetical protein [Bacteriophage sp.]